MSSTGGDAQRRAERRVGTTVHDKYTIERVLGVGGMATVYLAVHRNGHRVALKMLHPEVAADADMRARFVREGYAANVIEHRGVVRVLDDDETDDGVAFLVMELLDGETLHARARRSGGRLPEREVLALGSQLLDVLAAAHARGVLHRDIKPENLFLTRDGILKVLDFGIARIEGGLSGSEPTRTGRAMGTPAFMSPEQAFGRAREVDARSDVWGAGATLFLLLSGKHVHEAENAAEMLVYAATKPPPSLATVAPEIAPSVVSIIDRALAFEKQDRWPSAKEMGEAIASTYATLYGADIASALATQSTASRRMLESAPTIDVSAPPVASLRVAPRRKRRVVFAIAALALAGVVGGAIALFSEHAVPVPATVTAVAAGSVASSAALGECTTNATCAQNGARSICRASKCVPLESEDCHVLGWNDGLANDATIWVGAMFATHGSMAPEFAASINAVDLARRDFIEIANGLPSARAGGAPRPIGVILCNDGVDPLRAAHHLVDDVGVPAVLGFSRSKEVVDLALSVFNPHGVLALASNTAAMLSSIPAMPGQPRMVWRTTIGATVEAPAITSLVRDIIEPELRGPRHAVAAGDPIRVALVCFDNASGLGVSDAIVSQLRFNGKSVAENTTSFRQIVVPASPERASEMTKRVSEIVAFKPHLVIDMANGDTAAPTIEMAWPASDARRPIYVVSTTLTDPDVVALVKRRPDLQRRLFGVEAVSSTPAVAKFVLRYNDVFSPKVTPLSTTAAPYDAFYTLIYAIAALGESPITGASLARALARVSPPGTPIDVGPAGIYPALAILGRGENIDLFGTTTSLDFDTTTGDPRIDLAIYCIDGRRGDVASIQSGVFWRGAEHKLVGELRCP